MAYELDSQKLSVDSSSERFLCSQTAVSCSDVSRVLKPHIFFWAFFATAVKVAPQLCGSLTSILEYYLDYHSFNQRCTHTRSISKLQELLPKKKWKKLRHCFPCLEKKEDKYFSFLQITFVLILACICRILFSFWLLRYAYLIKTNRKMARLMQSCLFNKEHVSCFLFPTFSAKKKMTP